MTEDGLIGLALLFVLAVVTYYKVKGEVDDANNH